MVENKKVMAKNILKYMERDQVTATDICRALNIKQNTFSDWINAKTYPRIDKIELLATYFHISKSDLVEDKEFHADYIISDDERKIILEYRKADKTTREAVERLLFYSKLIEIRKGDNNGTV